MKRLIATRAASILLGIEPCALQRLQSVFAERDRVSARRHARAASPVHLAKFDSCWL